MDPALDRSAQQLVPGRMEDHFVPPIAEAVMGAQHRLILISFKPPALGLLGAKKLSQFLQLRIGPACAFSFDCFGEVGVRKIQVVPHEGRRLI